MKKSYLLVYFLILLPLITYAQPDGTTPDELLGQNDNVITTAVPFLLITPDARAAGMGDLGVATSPDVNSQHWNAAKYAFMEEDFAVGISYTPWLSKLINDMWIGYLTGYKRLSKYEGVAISLKYFDLGDVDLRNEDGGSLGVFNPKEYSFDASYSRKLGENLSMAITGRFIYSNLIGNIGGSNSQAKAGVSGAGDIGLYGFKDLTLSAKNARLSYGVALTNIGQKLTYSGNDQREFIPMNFRIGTALATDVDLYNKFTFAFDINKLMVPTPDGTNKNQDVTMLSGMFQSFGDAPGGFKEELQELILSFGAEYWYNKTFSGRIGYFNENRNKGNRKFLTFGLGLRYKKFGFDGAYMVPIKQYNALGETFRFSISLNLEKNKTTDTSITE